jgi:DNA-binding transcriptional ArsR family regulator
LAEEDKDRKIEELAERIAELEASIRMITKPYDDLVDQMERVQGIVNRYFGLLDLYQTHGGISIDVIIPQVKDPISKEIVRILLDHPRLNISQLAVELKKRLGSSSRRIVRSKLMVLIEEGIVVDDLENKVKTYSVSGAVIKRWSQVLGLSK